MIILQICAAWLLADAMSGLAHWILDTRLSAGGQFAGLVQDNVRHHAKPEAMLELTVWENLSTSYVSLILAGLLLDFGAPLTIWLSFVFLFFSNLVHRWAHERRSGVPRVVRWLQRIGVFQSPAHHARHHRADGRLLTRRESVRSYCVMSNFLNPLLNAAFRVDG